MSSSDQDKWDRIYERRAKVGPASHSLTSLAGYLPSAGRALDLAGGSGRNALWLASLGWDVQLVDVSDVALAQAKAEAELRALPLQILHADLETYSLEGHWDLILCCNFLERRVLSQIAEHLADDGVFIMAHPTRRNLERHKSPSARFLLQVGELATLIEGLQLLHSEEEWNAENRHEARIVARKR